MDPLNNHMLTQTRHYSHPDRLAMIEWAQQLLVDPGVVFLDTETTGFGPRAEIVDIAVISSTGDPIVETLVRPRGAIPPDASRIHGIHDNDVRDAPSWEQVHRAVLAAISGRRVIVYNADFDRGMIKNVCLACRLEEPSARWDCAMHAYAAFAGEPSNHWRGGYRRFKLDQAVRAFGITPGGHRAAADAEACRLLVHAIARNES